MDNKKIMTELYRLGELPKGWEKKIDADSIDREVGEILQSDQEILAAYRPSAMAREIGEKLRGAKAERTVKRARLTLATVGAAAAMVVFGLFLPGLLPSTGEEDLTRMKGKTEAGLTLYRNLGMATEVLDGSSAAREGDLIQLGYRIDPKTPYGIILSVDGRGLVTRHLAPEGGLAEKLLPGGDHLLDFAYELDDAPRFETFYLLLSDRTFPVDPVVDLLSREARSLDRILDIPEIIKSSSLNAGGIGKLNQYAVSIDKEE